MFRLFGVNILVPEKPTTTPTVSLVADHQSNALIPCTTTTVNPISSCITSSSSSSRKRNVSEYASSSSSTKERSNNNLGKKARHAMPPKEEVAMAKSKEPDLSPLLKTKVFAKLGVINDYIPKKIIQKFVYYSDVKENQARLSIPVNAMIKGENFLSKDELESLNGIGGGEIKVKVMYYARIEEQDGELKEKDMNLTRWPRPPKKKDEEKDKEKKTKKEEEEKEKKKEKEDEEDKDKEKKKEEEEEKEKEKKKEKEDEKEKEKKKTTVRYVVQHGWNDVVKDIGLKLGDSIQVWAFRYSNPPSCNANGDNLALVLVNLGNSKNLDGKSTDN